MHKQKIILAGFAALLLSTSTWAQEHKYDTWEENYTVQALLGAVKYEDLKFDNTDGTDPIEVDMSLIPQLGGAWTTMPQGEKFQYGLECSFLLGFKFDKVNYLSAGGSGLHVSISTSMWMFDLAGGGYANYWLTDSIRLYGGAGPLMMYSDYRSEREEEGGAEDGTYSDNESAFGIGLYTRTGIEFQVHQHGYLGAGARWNWSSVDFSDVGGTSDLSGIAAFVSYTAGF